MHAPKLYSTVQFYKMSSYLLRSPFSTALKIPTLESIQAPDLKSCFIGLDV